MVPILQEIINEITQVMDNVEYNQIEKAMEYIQKDCSVFISGEGRSGFMAKGFAMRLMHLGYSVYVIGETITPALKRGDVLILVSGSGESSSVVSNGNKGLERGCKLIAVTSKEQSSIGNIAHHILLVPGTIKGELTKERSSIQLLSSLFDQSLHIVLDAICYLLSVRDQVTNEKATSKHW